MSDNVIPTKGASQPASQTEWRAKQLAALAKANGAEVLDVSRTDKQDETIAYIAVPADSHAAFLRDVLEFIERESSL